MTTTRRRRSERAGRGKLRSLGRPSVGRLAQRRRFWAGIAVERSSEDAAIRAGVSPAVGTRWFREAGGMATSHLRPSAPPPSGRYLTFKHGETSIGLVGFSSDGSRVISLGTDSIYKIWDIATGSLVGSF